MATITNYNDVYAKDENGNTYLVSRTSETVIIPPNWDSCAADLLSSDTFLYAAQYPLNCNFNNIIYGALIAILFKAESDSLLKKYLQLVMNYTDEQKTEINTILTKNYFEIQIN